MQTLKIFIIQYSLWLYNLACVSWLLMRLGEQSIALWLNLAFPVAFAALFTISKNNLAAKILGLAAGKSRLWVFEMIIALAISFAMGWVIVEVKPIAFFSQAANTQSIIKGIFSPNFQQLAPMFLALVETIYLALLATVFALPFAFVLSFFAAKNLMFGSILGRCVYVFIRTISTVFRSIEAIVWAIIFCVWVGIGPFAGMLALWIHSIASLIKLYSEQIENIDPGPVEAIRATGASTLQIWRYGVTPQILAPYLAFTIYRWDINIRMATIVGFVGGGGIGLALYQEQQLLAWRNVGLIMWLIALVVWVMDMFSAHIRTKLISN